MATTNSGPGATPERGDYNNIRDLEHITALYRRTARKVKGGSKTVAILKARIAQLENAVKPEPGKGLEEAQAELGKFKRLLKEKSDKLGTWKVRKVGLEACVKKLEKKANIWRK